MKKSGLIFTILIVVILVSGQGCETTEEENNTPGVLDTDCTSKNKDEVNRISSLMVEKVEQLKDIDGSLSSDGFMTLSQLNKAQPLIEEVNDLRFNLKLQIPSKEHCQSITKAYMDRIEEAIIFARRNTRTNADSSGFSSKLITAVYNDLNQVKLVISS